MLQVKDEVSSSARSRKRRSWRSSRARRTIDEIDSSSSSISAGQSPVQSPLELVERASASIKPSSAQSAIASLGVAYARVHACGCAPERATALRRTLRVHRSLM